MNGLQALSISVRADHARVANDLCKAGIECATSGSISYVLLLVSAGFLVLFAVAAAVHLRQAQATVNEEQSRTRAEYEAFDELARDVATMSTPAPSSSFSTSGGPTALLTESAAYNHRPAAAQLQRVANLYESTVMAVPHYEEDYNDTLEQSMAAELGEDISTAVLYGTEFTPHLKTALVNKAREAQRQRKELLGGLSTEADELARAASEFDRITTTLESVSPERLHQEPFPALAELWDRLGSLEDGCERLVSDRQVHVHDHRLNGSPAGSEHTFYQYLYQSLPVKYPVLADATSVLSSIRHTRRRVLHELTTRV